MLKQVVTLLDSIIQYGSDGKHMFHCSIDSNNIVFQEIVLQSLGQNLMEGLGMTEESVIGRKLGNM